MVVTGLNDSQPIDENRTREGRQRNHRIEIEIVQIK